jgi:hypothetical protein
VKGLDECGLGELLEEAVPERLLAAEGFEGDWCRARVEALLVALDHFGEAIRAREGRAQGGVLVGRQEAVHLEVEERGVRDEIRAQDESRRSRDRRHSCHGRRRVSTRPRARKCAGPPLALAREGSTLRWSGRKPEG